MNQLLPLYNSILTYKQKSNDMRDDDEIIDDLMNSYGMEHHRYLKFVLFPDVYPACRPPTIFPHPTHIFRDIGSQSLTATGGALYIAWAPFTRYISSVQSMLTTWNGASVIGAVSTIGATVTGEVDTVFVPPTITGVDQEHVRGLAAFIQVTYLGRLDELSGVIEVGVAIDDAIASSNSSMTRYVATSGLKGLYQYKRMDVASGVRCVYLPLSTQSFDFTGLLNSQTNLNQVYHIHLTGVPATAGAFRIDYGYYYDGLVDESGYNVLLPRKPVKSAVGRDSVVKALQDNMDNAMITYANPADQGLVSHIWSGVKDSFVRSTQDFSKFLVGEGFNAFKDLGTSYLK